MFQHTAVVIVLVFNVLMIVAFTIIPCCYPVPLSAVSNMDIYEVQTTTMRVRWEEVLGATGYMLLYSAINATQPTLEQEVRDILGKHWEHSVIEWKGIRPISCGYDRFGQGDIEHMHVCLWLDTIAYARMHLHTPYTHKHKHTAKN